MARDLSLLWKCMTLYLSDVNTQDQSFFQSFAKVRDCHWLNLYFLVIIR